MNEAQRRKRIKEALAAREENGETEALPWRGQLKVFPVIEIELDAVVLNPNSHRIQAVLEDHPKKDVVKDHPYNEEAQEVLAEILRKRHKDFDALKDSLRMEGQREPGVVTRDSVLFNANTRTVALRDLNDPAKRWVRVAVLPQDADNKELVGLETALQVQDPLKDEYRLTEQLLLIEEKTRVHGMSPKEIALELRWASDDGRSLAKGAERVRQYLRLLLLVRQMQTMPATHLPLTVFDDKLEQLKALEKKYNSMLSDDSDAANAYLANWLATALAGSSSVHLLRAVDENFAGDYLLPHLKESELLGDHAEELLTGGDGKQPPPTGVEDLGDDSEEPDDVESVQGLLDILASNEDTVKLPGDDKKRDLQEVRTALETATKAAIKESRSADRAEDELNQPVALLREASRRLRQAEEAFRSVRRDDEFDQKRRGQFEYQLKRVAKALKEVQTLSEEEREEK